MSDAADLAQVLSFPFAVVPALFAVFRWWLAKRRATVVSAGTLADLRGQLALTMAAQWTAESTMRLLDDPDPIPVPWALTVRDDVMDREDNVAASALVAMSSADVTDLVARFRSMKRPRLVILGGAGSGKTTLAVQIVLDLLDTRAAGDPVPVLLSVAGWEPTSESQLDDWLAERIVRSYPDLAAAGFGLPEVRAAAVHGVIAPVLDGLDEAPATARAEIIDALNRWVHGDRQLVLTSRTEEFAEATNRGVLRAAAVIEPHPLTPVEAATYLERCLPPRAGESWDHILERLRECPGSGESGGAFAEVVTTPLGLWLVRMSYISPGSDPSPLVDPVRFASASVLRTHLFGRLIPATLAVRRPSENPSDLFRPRRQYDPGDVERWLRFLAVNLHRRKTRDFDLARDVPSLMAPARWPAETTRILARWSPPVYRAVSELAGRSRWNLIPMLVALGLAVTGIWSAANTTARVTTSALAPGVVADLAGFLAGCVLGLAFLAAGYGILIIGAAPGEVAPEEGTLLWRSTWSAVMPYVPPALYVLCWSALVYLTCGVVAYAAGAGHVRTIAFAAGVSAGAMLALLLWIQLEESDGQEVPLGGGSNARSLGWSPLSGLEFSLLLGLFLGGLLGLLVCITTSEFWDGALMAVAIVLVTMALTAALFAVPLVVVLPLAQFVAGVVTATVRLVAGQGSRKPGPNDPDALVRLWRFEALETKLRLVRVTVLTAILGAGAAVAASLLPSTSVWPAIRGGTMAAWVADLTTPSGRSWSGHLGYVLAALAAWLVTLLWGRWHRWRRWLLWAGLTLTLALLFRRLVTDDDFTIQAGSGGGMVTLRAQAVDSDPVTGTIDLDRVLFHSGGSFVAGALLLLALALYILVAVANEGEPSRIWWNVSVASWWHRRRGRLPADLPRFLDDAHRLGLLRAVGTVYQFRHAAFQDHLTSEP